MGLARSAWVGTAAAALGAALLVAGPADASRAPSKAEAKAIRKGFYAGRSRAATKVQRVRVSTVSRRYAAVSYRSTVRTSAAFAAPTPVVLRRRGKRWRQATPSRVPRRVNRFMRRLMSWERS